MEYRCDSGYTNLVWPVVGACGLCLYFTPCCLSEYCRRSGNPERQGSIRTGEPRRHYPGLWLAERARHPQPGQPGNGRSEEHTSELQSLMRISYAVFCLKKKK